MANARKILIVDDDTDLRDTLVEQLSLHDEFEASAVDTGAKGASAAKANAPDLVLMDVGLPDTDGREVVRSLRKGGFKAPIIMLTGHDTDSDTILGLESGAMTTSQNRSALRCCWRESGRNCASMKPARTRCSPSVLTASVPAPRC
jgi:CheY-like chemotaxis protein